MNQHYNGNKFEPDLKNKDKIILVGNPNVGKSVIFGLLTGKYVTVSNYPGTTVEVSRALSSFNKKKSMVIDTPGTNSLIPQSEDEKVTRDILLDEDAGVTIQVADAKNMRRALALSLQLAEMETPFILDLNMIDEARSRGIYIDSEKLSHELGIEVISTVATRRKGINTLIKGLSNPHKSYAMVNYDPHIEDGIKKIIEYIPITFKARRSIAITFLAGDEGIEKWISSRISGDILSRLRIIREELRSRYGRPISNIINQRRMEKVDGILKNVQKVDELKQGSTILQKFGSWSMHPFWGIPILLLVLFLTYKIVGEFAAGTCVDFLENTLFGQYINPFLIKTVNFLIPFGFIRELLVGDYGIITVAVTYSIAIVLPIVGFFFLIFGLMEDSGYMPRLAIMANRLFKMIGLNGTAILPMILGLGCATMATLTTRILPSKKERIIVTLLLALAVPCSAQLGVIFGETSMISPKATLIWAGTIIGVIFVVGFLSSIIIPGSRSDFILETPPIRLPKVSNIIIKTFARLEWYLKEAVPLFILGTFILFSLDKSGVLGMIEDAAAPIVVNLLGLPKEAAGAFIMGFLRRDYAAVLVVKGSNLDPIQMLVALVTITLFVPCVANLFIMIKERGLKVAMLIVLFVFTFAFLFGGIFNIALRYLEVKF